MPILFWHMVTKHIGAKAEVYSTIFGFIKELLKVLKTYFYELDFCLTAHHQLGKVIQMEQLDATMIY